MNKLYFLISLISCALIGVVLASLAVADIALPLKILIVFFIVLGVFILYAIQNTNDQLGKLLYFIRTMYISVETNRLDPNDKRPAKDILAEDIKHEKDMDEAGMELTNAKSISVILNFVLILIACFSAYLAYGYLK